MFNSVLKTAPTAVAFAALASAANAAVVSLQLQQSGFPTQTITGTTNPEGISSADFVGTYGTFQVSIGAQSPIVSPFHALLISGTPITSSGGGTLTILVTATGVVTAPPGPSLESSFAFEGFEPGTVQESTFVDPTDVAFSMADPLGSAAYTSTGKTTQRQPPSVPLTASYSLTEEYIITPAGGGLLGNSSIIIDVVPEPSTWAMMLIGFVGLGFAFRRRKMSFA
jgi:hypothetical protein